MTSHASLDGLRRGVTVLEVMISIGVVTIGFLGVVALVPLAGHQVSKGQTSDIAAVVGKNAIEHFVIRGMANPNNWIRGNGTQLDPYALPNKAFCIDPRFVAKNPAILNFPYPASASPTMNRMSLWSGSTNVQRHLTSAEADRLFVSQDQLSIDFPADKSELSQQTFVGGSTNALKREYEGQLSWFATLVPTRGGSRGDLYTLSVVVVNRRDPQMTTTSIAGAPDNERVVGVRTFFGDGYGGGDVLLEAAGTLDDQQLVFEEGDWLMLSSQQGSIEYFKWYRALAADEPQVDPNDATLVIREVSLEGADWPTTSAGAPLAAQATIVTGVVAVYEKTIRLESSSLWTQ